MPRTLQGHASLTSVEAPFGRMTRHVTGLRALPCTVARRSAFPAEAVWSESVLEIAGTISAPLRRFQ
ncbi:MAG: hypothetical protein ACLQBX_15535 [Candidatus Limnocylindrales bacterium]|jgi:hypothetical protein